MFFVFLVSCCAIFVLSKDEIKFCIRPKPFLPTGHAAVVHCFMIINISSSSKLGEVRHKALLGRNSSGSRGRVGEQSGL
jgi:hypothetical protein